MSFEDRIRQAVGHALDDIRTRMEQEVRALVRDLATDAAEERQLAIAHARDHALTEAKQRADQRVAETEAHLTATIDRVVADACAREREQATLQARRTADAEAEARARRVLEAVRSLDAAGSLSEVLDALGAAVRREAGRSAVFVVRGASFQGWTVSGFGTLDSQPGRLDVPVAHAPLVQLAVQSGHPVASSDGEPMPMGPDSALTSFTGTGLAVPVVVSTRVVAVVYADLLSPDGREAAVPKGWNNIVELLSRHAARCLEALQAQPAVSTPTPSASRLTTERGVGVTTTGYRAESDEATHETGEASARRLAKLLIAEIRLHNESSVSEGRRTGNLLTRLGPQIERARRVYDARVPATLTSRAQLFHQELVTTLADGDASRLGVSA